MPSRKPSTHASKTFRDVFSQLLGAETGSERRLVGMVESGLPLTTIAHLLEQGLSKDEVANVIVNPRTLKHRKNRRQPLSKEESERAVRAARLLAKAESVFGNREAALGWLRGPQRRFEGRSPMQMIATEPGGRLVEEMLVQIDNGMFA